MSVAVGLSTVATVLLVAMLIHVHRRFTMQAVELGPQTMLGAGVPPLLWHIAAPAASALTVPGIPVAILILAIVGALSVRVRYITRGIPSALALDTGPSNYALAQLVEHHAALMQASAAHAAERHAAAQEGHTAAQERHAAAQERHAAAQDRLSARLDALQERLDADTTRQAERHAFHLDARLADRTTAASDLRDALALFAVEQERQNRSSLIAALSGVIADFQTQINSQFRAHLLQLHESVANNVALQDRHRAQQAEMMHHARRNADQMSLASQSFADLVSQSVALAGIGEQLRQSLDLLGPRQDQLTAGLNGIDGRVADACTVLADVHRESDALADTLAQRNKQAIDALGQRVSQHANELSQLVQRTAEQSRSLAAEAAGKGQQQVAALNKELSDALNKLSGSIGKQLNGFSSKLSNDLAPMAQQVRRVAEQSKALR